MRRVEETDDWDATASIAPHHGAAPSSSSSVAGALRSGRRLRIGLLNRSSPLFFRNAGAGWVGRPCPPSRLRDRAAAERDASQPRVLVRASESDEEAGRRAPAPAIARARGHPLDRLQLVQGATMPSMAPLIPTGRGNAKTGSVLMRPDVATASAMVTAAVLSLAMYGMITTLEAHIAGNPGLVALLPVLALSGIALLLVPLVFLCFRSEFKDVNIIIPKHFAFVFRRIFSGECVQPIFLPPAGRRGKARDRSHRILTRARHTRRSACAQQRQGGEEDAVREGARAAMDDCWKGACLPTRSPPNSSSLLLMPFGVRRQRGVGND